MGFSLVLYANAALQGAVHGMQSTLSALKEKGVLDERAVTSFAEGTQFSKNFERFIEKVNADGKGVIRINYIGGPRAMPSGNGA